MPASFVASGPMQADAGQSRLAHKYGTASSMDTSHRLCLTAAVEWTPDPIMGETGEDGYG